MQKYGHTDARPVLERASARETAARVALGEVARRYVRQAFGIDIVSHVVAIGSVTAPAGAAPGPNDGPRVDEDPVRCLDPGASVAMRAEIDAARKDGDTLGGVIEVIGYGLPPGLGSHVHWDRRLDARLAAALMSIHAIKGVEIGDGFATARRRGSQAHDEIEGAGNAAAGGQPPLRRRSLDALAAPAAPRSVAAGGQPPATPRSGVRRRTNRAGGIEGGMSTGEPLRARAAMKPISTVPRALDTVDVSTGEAAKAINQRSDVTAVPAAGVVAEAMTALVLAEAAAEKFGGDSVAEVRRNLRAYLADLVIA
jgi:chorismate synthase